MADRLYPAHIYEPLRVDMAAEVTAKELRKLLPSVPQELWPKLDRDISNWFDGEKSELAPVHCFWNGCEGITQGFKLKRVVRYFSAKNIHWRKTKIDIERVPIGWPVGTLSDLGPGPYTAMQIRTLLKDPEFKQKNIELSDKHSLSSVPRDHYPIIITVDNNNRYVLHDGNRRTLRAILQGKQTIDCYLGQTEDYHNIRDYWVSTPWLRNLVRVADVNETPDVTAAVKTILKRVFNESEIAIINYRERVCSQSKLAQTLFDELVL